MKSGAPPPKISSKILFKTLVKYLLNHVAENAFSDCRIFTVFHSKNKTP